MLLTETSPAVAASSYSCQVGEHYPGRQVERSFSCWPWLARWFPSSPLSLGVFLVLSDSHISSTTLLNPSPLLEQSPIYQIFVSVNGINNTAHFSGTCVAARPPSSTFGFLTLNFTLFPINLFRPYYICKYR